jgi:hypothetical protein
LFYQKYLQQRQAGQTSEQAINTVNTNGTASTDGVTGEKTQNGAQESGGGQVGNDVADRRIRLSAKPLAREIIYGPANDPSNLLSPLWQTGGMMWPYTPAMSDVGNVEYENYDPIHTNQPFAAFKKVAAKEIQISGPFTALNEVESRYCVAVIHFLRSVTKMYFGLGGSAETISRRGTPPPILLLNGYGSIMYNNIPVIITNFVIDLPADVDYVNVPIGALPSQSKQNAGGTSFSIPKSMSDVNKLKDNALKTAEGIIQQPTSQNEAIAKNDGLSAWVPTKFTITVNLQVQNTPDRWRRKFDLDGFRTGKLVKSGGWI